MKARRHWLALLLLIGMHCAGAAGQSTAPDLRGRWEGTLTPAQGPLLTQPKGAAMTHPYRLDIGGKTTHVFVFGVRGLEEVKPGKFKVDHVMSNMTIYATDMGRDNEGVWVETWVFAVTQKDKDTLMVTLCRVVNNLDLPESNDHSKFMIAASGEFHRVN